MVIDDLYSCLISILDIAGIKTLGIKDKESGGVDAEECLQENG